ncbi:hypothetical protein F3Y22_tig00112402pilonHSYRG00183 [Hibiscus syriacus]|uniref:Uncharacterized protein n=1 Tax=Hibiscus syriacus TaxID=106335 RepID=A0A6A2Y8C8_HIBSY|nr:hypothetical protein F3Y22_tig00112402pilonHSYRG00183 [Hibiscus syriacus]
MKETCSIISLVEESDSLTGHVGPPSTACASALSWGTYMLAVLGVFTVVTMWVVVVIEGCRKIKLQYYGFKLASVASFPVSREVPSVDIMFVGDWKEEYTNDDIDHIRKEWVSFVLSLTLEVPRELKIPTRASKVTWVYPSTIVFTKVRPSSLWMLSRLFSLLEGYAKA